MQDEDRQTVLALCGRALDGTLDLGEFSNLWPESLFAVPFYSQVHDDLEDGVEHTPGFFLKRGVDQNAWMDSDAYLRIYLDSVLLACGRKLDELLQCRNSVFEHGCLSRERIQNSVKEYFRHDE